MSVDAVSGWRWWRPPPLVMHVLYGSAVTALIVLGSLGESYPSRPDHRLPPGSHPPPWPAYLLVAAAGWCWSGATAGRSPSGRRPSPW